MESMKRYSWQRRKLNGLLQGIHGAGLDVGAGKDPYEWWTLPELADCDITHVDTWDREQGDAHYLPGVPVDKYDFLFSSHCLEHLPDRDVALASWVSVVKPGGHLLIAVPHQVLYEEKRELPSSRNPNHRHFFTPTSFLDFLRLMSIVLPFTVEALQTGDWHNFFKLPHDHPVGEYQIDALLRKRDD